MSRITSLDHPVGKLWKPQESDKARIDLWSLARGGTCKVSQEHRGPLNRAERWNYTDAASAAGEQILHGGGSVVVKKGNIPSKNIILTICLTKVDLCLCKKKGDVQQGTRLTARPLGKNKLCALIKCQLELLDQNDLQSIILPSDG